jgi:hypothetical protein
MVKWTGKSIYNWYEYRMNLVDSWFKGGMKVILLFNISVLVIWLKKLELLILTTNQKND